MIIKAKLYFGKLPLFVYSYGAISKVNHSYSVISIKDHLSVQILNDHELFTRIDSDH